MDLGTQSVKRCDFVPIGLRPSSMVAAEPAPLQAGWAAIHTPRLLAEFLYTRWRHGKRTKTPLFWDVERPAESDYAPKASSTGVPPPIVVRLILAIVRSVYRCKLRRGKSLSGVAGKEVLMIRGFSSLQIHKQVCDLFATMINQWCNYARAN